MSSSTINNHHSEPEASAPVILAVDTSTARPAMAIRRATDLLAALVSSRVEPHSRTLFDNLNLLLEQAALTIDEIDLFAVVTGPGSFTGLRVGISALTGLAAARGRPLCGIDRLELQARALGCAGTILVLSEAGRGEVYAGLRRLDAAGSITSPAGDLYGPPAAVMTPLLAQLDPVELSRLLITGDAVERVHPILTQLARESSQPLSVAILTSARSGGWQVVLPDDPLVFQLARTVSHLHHTAGVAGLPPCVPFYVRPSDAEINWQNHDAHAI